MTPLPPLNDAGLCLFCADGLHGRCIDPDCECEASGPRRRLQHRNRPPRGRTPPEQKGNDMANPAPITPIDRGKKPAPRFELRKVGELPAKATTMRLADRVKQLLDGNELEPGQWYECIRYPGTGGGAGGAATRLSNDERLADYEFEARAAAVYVRLKAAPA